MPYQVAVLGRLHRAGIPLAIYGKYWQEGEQASAPVVLRKLFSTCGITGGPSFAPKGSADCFMP